MTRLGCTIRFDGSIPSGRRFREVRVATHRAVAEAWAERYLARHFQAGASGRYGYSPRSKATRQRKRRRGRPYLVEEGELRQMALATVPYGIKAAPNYIKLSADTPPYITQQQQAGLPDYPAEVFATTPTEEADLMRVGEAYAEEMLEKTNETRTVNIG